MDYFAKPISTNDLKLAILKKHEHGIYSVPISYAVVMAKGDNFVNPITKEEYRNCDDIAILVDGEWFYVLCPMLSNFDDVRRCYTREDLEDYIIESPFYFHERRQLIENRIDQLKYLGRVPKMLNILKKDNESNERYEKFVIEKRFIDSYSGRELGKKYPN